ncbi:hypothetical protein CERSUDRAFT_119455 [Gelatoporia subvermispora B]|uniref:Glycosyltransferase 2-like domain-containing protein n=1 Tax=Ceriporiopsis subvermispora (strain B) TaxID=914234 RepID=M2QYN9_CERS8|nr:hypothetical protein CERSUDRAFT_119455 [Gelatoporia subvermispora B]
MFAEEQGKARETEREAEHEDTDAPRGRALPTRSQTASNARLHSACANGEVAPFVGHNAFLRWKAIQDAAFIDPAGGQEKIWSETNMSEGFDMALRLQMRGYIIRWATHSRGGFKEGVSLTVDDELNRWQTCAFGCSELLFNPFVQWWRKGPIAHQIHRFLWLNAPMHYKISMMSYMFSYYGIAAAITISIVNYVLLGFQFPVDGFYMRSFEIWLATTVVFIGSGNVGFTLLEYRIGEKDLLASLWQQIKLLNWPGEGVIHIALGAVSNALWDMYARSRKKPLWKLIVLEAHRGHDTEELLSATAFRYIIDAITREEALATLQAKAATKAEHEARVRELGYPAYVTFAGWLGYSDEKVARLTREAVEAGFNHFKMKVGADRDNDLRRGKIIRSIIDAPQYLPPGATPRDPDAPELRGKSDTQRARGRGHDRDVSVATATARNPRRPRTVGSRQVQRAESCTLMPPSQVLSRPVSSRPIRLSVSEPGWGFERSLHQGRPAGDPFVSPTTTPCLHAQTRQMLEAWGSRTVWNGGCVALFLANRTFSPRQLVVTRSGRVRCSRAVARGMH